MCFHLAATAKAKTLKARFKADFPQEEAFVPSEYFNAFAHPLLPVITADNPQQIDLFNWGLVPYWVKNEDMAKKMMKSTLNARIETAFEKPSFREPMRYQRCIIPATSFYEWQHVSSAKIEVKPEVISAQADLFPQSSDMVKIEAELALDPQNETDKVKYKISTDQEVFAFAGIWDSWQDKKGFSILTMPANPLMEKIHNSGKRMPFILKPENEMKWLDPERQSYDDLKELILPYSDELMQAIRI